jgi:V/A-type H+-transporting ATPase subunit E
MKAIDSGSDKIKKICEVLRTQTLEPAKEEAGRLVIDAKTECARLLKEAKQEADRLIETAKLKIEEEKTVMKASLALASRQAVEKLKQDLESQFFHPELTLLLQRKMGESKWVAALLENLVAAVKKEGLSNEIQAVIASSIDKEAVAAELGTAFLNTLKEQSLTLGSFAGGVEVKLLDARLTIDVTEETIKNLLVEYLREDFRKIVLA